MNEKAVRRLDSPAGVPIKGKSMISKKTLNEYLIVTAVTAVILRLFFFEEWVHAADVLLRAF